MGPSHTNSIDDGNLLSQRSFNWLLAAVLVYFGARLVFFAVSISPLIPPDETTHFGICRIYSGTLLMPENSPDTYTYGLVTNIPYLYYWIMGRLLVLNFFGISDLLFLRLLNILLALATIFFVLRMLRLLTDNRLARIVLAVAMTNTLMFSFLSASVSYDNLTNLLAAMAVYYLLAFFKTRSGGRLAFSLLCQFAGCLTKVAFLPLALILDITLLLHETGNIRNLPGALRTYFHAIGWPRHVLMLGIFFFLALNIQLYVGNYLHHGSLTPTMAEVLSPGEAMQNRLEARNMIFNLFKEGKVSMGEALDMTSQISHPGDRADAKALIFNYAYMKDEGSGLMGIGAYAVFWAEKMAATVFGIAGHLAMLSSGPTLWPFSALIILTVLSVLIRWRPSDILWLPSCLLMIVFSYASVLFVVNHRTYLDYWTPAIALQGRYIFPVLGPVYVLSTYYLLRLFRNKFARLAMSVAVCFIFIGFDFPYFLLRVTSQWFAAP